MVFTAMVAGVLEWLSSVALLHPMMELGLVAALSASLLLFNWFSDNFGLCRELGCGNELPRDLSAAWLRARASLWDIKLLPFCKLALLLWKDIFEGNVGLVTLKAPLKIIKFGNIFSCDLSFI